MTSAAGFAVLVLAACSAASPGRPAPRPDAAREQMVKEQIESRGIKDPLTLAALREVPRHEFVPEASGGENVLEIGTGSGYQSAVLARIAGKVHTIEIVPELAEQARARLARLGYRNVQVRAGDGYLGWPEAAPFDAIIVTAAAPRIPEPLEQQLAEGGRLVLPVGEENQELIVVTRHGSAFDERRVLPVRFVPMTGAVRKE